MNMQVNNVSFSGKNEIYYGLKKVAEESAAYNSKSSMSIGAHPINMWNSIAESKGKLSAYADMVINDGFIKEGLQEATEDRSFIKYCKKVLTPDCQSADKESPLQCFKKVLKFAAKNSDDDTKTALNKFLAKIR